MKPKHSANKNLYPLKLWAIIDIQKESPRYCYEAKAISKGCMGFYDKKPVIPIAWKKFKRVTRAVVEPVKYV